MDDDQRMLRVQSLRDAAAEHRRTAASGDAPRHHLLLANLLDARAARIDAGEDDHSGIDTLEG